MYKPSTKSSLVKIVCKPDRIQVLENEIDLSRKYKESDGGGYQNTCINRKSTFKSKDFTKHVQEQRRCSACILTIISTYKRGPYILTTDSRLEAKMKAKHVQDSRLEAKMKAKYV